MLPVSRACGGSESVVKLLRAARDICLARINDGRVLDRCKRFKGGATLVLGFESQPHVPLRRVDIPAHAGSRTAREFVKIELRAAAWPVSMFSTLASLFCRTSRARS